jgi:hypothetical protein
VRRGLGIIAVLTVLAACDSSHPPTSANLRLGLPSASSVPSPRISQPDPSLLDSLTSVASSDGDEVRMVSGVDGVLVLWRSNRAAPSDLEPAPTVTRRGLSDDWNAGWIATSPGETLVIEVDGVSFAGTAGALPGPDRSHTLLSPPRACADRLFPTRVAGGLATCSEPGSLDRWNARPLPAAVDPGRAAGAPWGVALASSTLGVWSPEASRLVRFRERKPLGRPAAGAGLVVVAALDRLEYGEVGSPRRSVVGARPLAGRGGPTISTDYVAWIDGHRTASLMLRRLSPPAVAAIPGTSDPTRPQLSAGWLTYADADTLRGIGLRGQASWSAAVDCGFSDGHVTFDDFRLVPDRSEGRLRVLAVHLPTGAVLPAWDDTDWVRLRGADPSGLTAQVYRPGTVGELAERATTLRILEEDGGLASSALDSRLGGHGGRHGLLPAGQSYQVSVPAGPRGQLSVWMPAGANHGAVRAVQQGASVGTPVAPTQPEGGWLPIGQVLRGAPVEVTWTAAASGDGLAVDALRIDRDML